MKKCLLVFFLLNSLQGYASESYVLPVRQQYDITSSHPFSYDNFLYHRSQQTIARYMQENFECGEVKMCIKSYIPRTRGFLGVGASIGVIKSDLKVVCSKKFENMKIWVQDPSDWGDGQNIYFGYTQNGKKKIEAVRGYDNAGISEKRYSYFYKKKPGHCDDTKMDVTLNYEELSPRFVQDRYEGIIDLFKRFY